MCKRLDSLFTNKIFNSLMALAAATIAYSYLSQDMGSVRGWFWVVFFLTDVYRSFYYNKENR